MTRRLGRQAGAGLLMCAWLGCGAPPTPAGTSAATGPTAQTPTKPETPAKPETPRVDPTPTPVPTPPNPDGETLAGRAVIAAADGPWQRRSLGAPTGGSDGGGDSGSGESIDGLGGGGGGPGSASGGFGGLGAAAPWPARGREGGGAMKRGGPPLGAPFDGSSPPATKTPQPKDSGPLKAGSTDDNADYKGYLKFLATWTGRGDVTGQFQPLDVAARGFVRVVDGDGRPVPGARVEVVEAGTKRSLWKATTYGDGRTAFYPRLFGEVQPTARYEATATVDGAAVTASWDGAGELELASQQPRPDAPLQLEVLFLIDTTGSMGDEIDRIKTTLVSVTDQVRGKREGLVLRYGAVLYKDVNDEYVTLAHPFTADTAAFSTALQAITAGGGGDLPESLNQGLSRAVEGMAWTPEAAKIVFLVCDAPPQMHLKGDVLYGDSAVRALSRGIRVHAVAASGLDPLGTLVLRQIAQLTRGKFIFIEYGGTQASAAQHGVAGPVEGGNNLDQILLAQITAELDGWGK